MSVQSVAEGQEAFRRARQENETLYAVIKTVSSSLDLDRVLRGIVDIATDATGLPRLLHLLPRGRAARASRRVPALLAIRGRARARRRRGPHRRRRAHEDARVHPRQRARRPADEVHPGARGGAVPVDDRGADPRQGRRRDRSGRPAHRGPARVRRRRAQLPRPHRVARRRGDRERAALRGDPPARPGAHHADPAEPGARRGHPTGGPLRRRHARRPRAARRRRVPDLPPRHRVGRARARGLGSRGVAGAGPAPRRGAASCSI